MYTDYIVFGLTSPEFEPTIYCTRDEHANHYNIYAVSNLIEVHLLW
jgi:hypothetical protein